MANLLKKKLCSQNEWIESNNHVPHMWSVETVNPVIKQLLVEFSTKEIVYYCNKKEQKNAIYTVVHPYLLYYSFALNAC